MLDPMFALGSVLTKDIITAAQMGLLGGGGWAPGAAPTPRLLGDLGPGEEAGSGSSRPDPETTSQAGLIPVTLLQ